MSAGHKFVMVVDDDDALRESVCELLEDDGYVALGVESGSAALAHLRATAEKPDLIVLDLMMPGMSGWEFRDEQLRERLLAEIPVIVMTASRELHGITANEVIFKPLTRGMLLAAVKRHAGEPKGLATALFPPKVGDDSEQGRKDTDRPSVAEFARSSDVAQGAGEMGALLYTTDWARTPLGPIETWSTSLRTLVSAVLQSRFPMHLWWSRELVLIYNDAYQPMLGDKHPRSFGASARDVWAEIWDVLGPQAQSVLDGGPATWNEHLLLFLERKGFVEETYWTFSYSPARDDSGSVGGVLVTVQETTEQVQGERQLEMLRELGARGSEGRSVEEACHSAVAILSNYDEDIPFGLLYLLRADGTGDLVATAGWGDQAAAAAGIPRPELNSWPIERVADSGEPLVVSDLEARLGAVPEGRWKRPPDQAVILSLLGGGQSQPYGYAVLGVSPMRALDERYRRMFRLVADQIVTSISAASAFQEERRRALALAEIDRAKTAFFSNVSHEFRTPLTLMLGPTEDLLSGANGRLEPGQREQLELIHRSELRLHKLVNALLDFSRIEAGRMQASYEPTDLASLTRDLVSAFHSAVERARLTLTVNCPPLEEPIFVDVDMWEKIVMNLLSNALKFTFEGGITVSLALVGHLVELRVADTGVGVPEQEMPRLFERFHRVQGAQARTHEGSGIGLALVQELVKLHGGAVVAESRLGEGTSFIVTIPRGRAHLPQDRIGAVRTNVPSTLGSAPFVEEAQRWLLGSSEARQAPSSVAAISSPDVEPPAQKSQETPRILVVDDNADMREYVRRLLEPHWNVEVVEDGIQALASARARPPDLLLTDVMMPGLDGFSLLHALRKDETTKSVPVVMLSARAGEEAKLEGLHAGAEDYLVKPFSARELLARVKTHLELGRLRSELRAQREHLYSLFMQAPVPVCVFRGSELVFEMANPLYLSVAGLESAVGKTFLEAFPHLRGQGFDDLLRGVLRTGEAYVGKEMLVRLDRDHDGVLEDIYFTFIYAPIRDERGAVDRVMVVVNDVTEQASSRQRIQESEENFRRIVTQVQAGIAQTDLLGRFTLTNERYREIVGRSEAELGQLRVQDITHPEDLPATLEHFRRLIQEGVPFVIEKRHLKPDGSIVWVQNSFSRIEDREGRPQGAVLVSIDITRRKFAEQGLVENEERYRTLVEQIMDYAIFRTDAEGRATTWNEGVKRVLGFDEEDFIGVDVTETIFTPEDVRAAVPQQELEIAAKEGTASNDRWMVRKNGERFFATGVTSALRAPDGKLVGFTKVMRDQTGKLRAEEAAAHLAAIVTSSDDAIVSTDLQGTIRSWNRGAERLYGYQTDEVVGKYIALLVPEDRVDEEPEILARIAHGEGFDHYETVRRRKDGSLIDVSLTASPVRDRSGRIIGGAKITRDITEKKRAEREREARVAEIERSLTFTERFIGILGHDLRNPLGAIITASDLLLRRETSERIARPIQRIHTSAERMTRMIEQILDLTRARIGGGISIVPTPVDIQALAGSLVEELEGAAPQQILLESVGDVRGEWDGDRLAQVISNLLGNAIEHGAANEPVKLRLDGSEPELVRISVANAGTVPAHLLPNLFDPFRGAPPLGKPRKSKGLGLGLYIVQQIVQAHGGNVELQTSDGSTTFLVLLPRVAVPRGVATGVGSEPG